MQPAIKPVTPRPSRLAAVQHGRQRTARRIFLYGDGGLGKSTLAAGAPRPLWIDLNQGSLGFDVARYTFDEDGRTKPASFEELLGALQDVAGNGAGQFDTLVVDTLSDVEQLVWAAAVKADTSSKTKPQNIEDVGGGFQKGYVIAVDFWRRLVAVLEDAWRAGLHIVLIDHTDVKKEKNISGADYGRAMPKIHPFASKFLHAWADYTFFLEVEKTLVPDAVRADKAKKEFAVSDGKRILHSRPAAEWMAKSRPELPDPIELPRVGGWQALEGEIRAAHTDRVDELRASIEARMGGLAQADADAARAALERAGGDDSKLEQLDNWCAARAAKKGA